jgi:hypothetical protein
MRPDKRVEQAAVRFLARQLRRMGYRVRSRETEICGYDLHATRGVKQLHIEVKGCRGIKPRFFISRTERQTAQEDPSWRLVLVTRVVSRNPKAHMLTQPQMQRAYEFQPTQWEAVPRYAMTATYDF